MTTDTQVVLLVLVLLLASVLGQAAFPPQRSRSLDNSRAVTPREVADLIRTGGRVGSNKIDTRGLIVLLVILYAAYWYIS